MLQHLDLLVAFDILFAGQSHHVLEEGTFNSLSRNWYSTFSVVPEAPASKIGLNIILDKHGTVHG